MLTNIEMTFEAMATRFGEITAYAHLEQIERAAGISPRQMTGVDLEIRLARALRAQDALSVFERYKAAA